MEEASFMEHVKTAPSSDELFQNPMAEEDDSFVPESLRLFMEDANAKLDADLNDILNESKNSILATSTISTKAKPTWMEDDDNDMEEDSPPPPDMSELENAAISMFWKSNQDNDANQQNEETLPDVEQEEEPIMAKLEQMDDLLEPITMPSIATQPNKPFEQLTTRDLLQPKPIPDHKYATELEDSSNQFFSDILQQEQDLSLKHNLMMGLLTEDKKREEEFARQQKQQQEEERAREKERLAKLQRQQQQQGHYYEEDSSIPPLESMNAPIVPVTLVDSTTTDNDDDDKKILEAKIFQDDDDDLMLEELLGDNPAAAAGGQNPAAFLTAGEAKDMALEGAVPPALEPDSDDDDDKEDMPTRRDLSAELAKAEQDFATSSSSDPSPPKRPKLEGMDAILKEDDEEEENPLERSYISSSSEDDELPTNQPQSPPLIVHQTETLSLQAKHQIEFQPTTTTMTQKTNRLQPPVPEMPHHFQKEDRDLLQQALDIQSKAKLLSQKMSPGRHKAESLTQNNASSKLLDFLHPNINEGEPSGSKVAAAGQEERTTPVKPPKTLDHAKILTPPSMKESSSNYQNDARGAVLTPPSMSQQPPAPNTTNPSPPSPVGAVNNLFDYLHPTEDNNAQKKHPSTNLATKQRKQLFAGPPTVEPKQRPTAEVTIPPTTTAGTTTVAASPMSRTTTTNQNHNAFSPTSSIGFGSPASELRRKRQLAMAQSPASTPSRGQSPHVHKKHPPRELTSPDKNISSRLLQGTAATRAAAHPRSRKTLKQQQQQQRTSLKSMATARVAKTTAPLNRFMQPTQASRRLNQKSKETTMLENNNHDQLPKRTRTTTAVSATSRLLQPTQASQALRSTAAEEDTNNSTALAAQKATRARIRERMAASRGGRAVQKTNREKKAEQKRNIKSTMDRVRERKERMAKMEQERVAKLKAKIAERDRKVQERKAKLEAERTSPVKARTRPKSGIPRPLTVPKTPNFLTDKRLRSPERPKEEMVTLANADNVLRQSFRDDHSMGGGSTATGERKLTIPKTPNFLTDKRLRSPERPKQEMIPLAAADAVLRRSFRDDQSMGGGSTATGERKLTIPKTPNFLTDKRLRSPERPKEEMIPLAAADAVLRRSFRDDQSMGGGSTATGERKLTIPKTPNLVTSKKYGDKSSAAKRVDDDEGSVHHWQDGLRTATSPSNKSVCSQLTIPQTPNFQPSRKREPVMSTAEKEQAEMDYFKAHPFKARPVGSGIKHVSSTAKKQVEKRKLTVPKPFRLSAGRRTTATPDQGQPKTLFPAPRGTPVEGFTMKAKRSTTTPKPFQLSTSRRQSFSPTEAADDPPRNISLNSAAKKKFHARPMPKFNSVIIPVRAKDPSKLRSPPSKEPEEVKPFKARGVPKTLRQPSIPVRQRDPAKLRSPDYIKTSPEYIKRHGKVDGKRIKSPDSSESKPFRAKPAPFRSPPSIPVRGRDPRKLRPVESKKKDVPGPPSLAGSSYSSNAPSLETRVDKRKAVRENMRQRMRERRGKKASAESVGTTDSSRVGPSLDTTVTTSSDGVSSSYGDSGATTSYGDSGFSTSYTESTLQTGSVQVTTKVGRDAPVGAGAVSPNSEREKSLLQAAMNKWPKGEASLAAVPTTAESEAATPVKKGGQSNKEELKSAMGGWMFDSVSATANAGSIAARVKSAAPKPRVDRMSEIRRAEPDPLEVARLAEEKRKQEELMRQQNVSKTYEETTQMAFDLQQQLEDALSFEATYSAGDDLDQGYIGQPAEGLGRFDL